MLAEQSFHTYKYPLEVLAKHPETKHAIVDYRELVAEPKRDGGRDLRGARHPAGARLSRALLDEEQARAQRHESGHRYSLAEFGLDADAIERELAELFERYRWARRRGCSACRPTDKAKAELRAAFDEMIASLARARDAIDDPALHAAARERAQSGRGLPLSR